MELNKDSTELTLRFRAKQKENVAECLNLTKYILELSNQFRSTRLEGGRSSKKRDKVRRIREGIEKFVNRDGVDPEFIGKLMHLIRIGKIEHIRTMIKGHSVQASATTDFTDLTLKLLGLRPKV